MKQNRNWSVLTVNQLILMCLVLTAPLIGQDVETWHLFVDKKFINDEAVKVVLGDLQNTGITMGLEFHISDTDLKLTKNSILVGSPDRNQLTKALFQDGKIELMGVDEHQGYEIITKVLNDNNIVVISGGSLLGDVYGLYWLWDRIRVFEEIPEINVRRIPELKIRFTGGGSKEAIRNALRHGATWVWGGISVNDLIPWDVEPERSNNAKNREKMKELIEYAHALHLKFFVAEDEFSYHPSLLDEFAAVPSPNDPAFWDAVQAKYRRLLKALPEIDGIRIRTGESTRVGGNYKALDVMHEGEGCDWSLAKRYRTFVKKIYNVVVGEFDKIYYQRTWVTSAHEQHSMATVYQEIFTDAIPVKNLYLSPYLSTTDRYFHQPYNPTFNLTPHNMIVLLAPLDYHSHGGVNTFPTFPGQYFQAGLQTILSSQSTNLKGVDFGTSQIDDWNTRAVTAYTVSRLSWNQKDNVREIARDFAAIHFGYEVAESMADIYLDSPNAYKYGIYIEPVSYGDFRSLPHLRLTTFPAKGLPRLDSGKKHIEFLYKIYLRCKPWIKETLMYLDHGLNIADSMVTKFQAIKPLISEKNLAQGVANAVELTYQLIKTNNLYVKTFFAYFEYREYSHAQNKSRLTDLSTELKVSMESFRITPGCVYRLDGIDQLVKNVEQALSDLSKAEEILSKAPDEEEIKAIILNLQEKSTSVLDEYNENAVKLLHWEGRVDGRDLVKIKSRQLEIEHLRYDPIAEMKYQFFNALPAEPVTVIPVDIESRSYKPFILEQPSKSNDFTVTIYLSDFPCHGYSWWKFDLFYITKEPEELGLAVPWQN